MASRVEDIFVEVDNIMEEMRTYPVADIEDGFTDNDLMWLESNVRACLKQFMDMVWEVKYEDEMDAKLKHYQDEGRLRNLPVVDDCQEESFPLHYSSSHQSSSNMAHFTLHSLPLGVG